MTSTTTGTPSPFDDELASLKGKLAGAEAEFKKWSDFVERAVLGEDEHKGKEAAYKEREALWISRVKDLENQISGKCFLPN